MDYYKELLEKYEQKQSRKAKIYFQYYEQLEKIMQEKQLNEFYQMFLKLWLLSMVEHYDSNKNILEHTPVEKYIQENFHILEKLDSLKIYGLDDILNDSTNYFYKHMEKIPHAYPVFQRFRKEKEQYVLDNENGTYALLTIGVCKSTKTTRAIEIMASSNFPENFHHELRHASQFFDGYYYSSEYPFSFDMMRMLSEGDAIYHERLLENKKYNKLLATQENEVPSVKTYHIYFQLYMLLMFILPKQTRDRWKFSNLELIHIPQKYHNFITEIFAILTLLLAKNNKCYKDVDMEASIALCMQKFTTEGLQLLVELAKEKNEVEIKTRTCEYQQLRVNIKDCELNTDVLKQKEKRQWNEENHTLELLERLQFLEKEINRLKQKETPEALLEGDMYHYNQYLLYQFGMNLSFHMQQLYHQNLSFEQLFQMLIEMVKSYLMEIKDPYLEEKFAFLESMKNQNLENQKTR